MSDLYVLRWRRTHILRRDFPDFRNGSFGKHGAEHGGPPRGTCVKRLRLIYSIIACKESIFFYTRNFPTGRTSKQNIHKMFEVDNRRDCFFQVISEIPVFFYSMNVEF